MNKLKLVKLLSICIAVFFATACTKIVTQKDIIKAEKYCNGKGGVFSIAVVSSPLIKFITCRNGDKADTGEVK